MGNANIHEFVDSATAMIRETIGKMNNLKGEKAQLTQEQADELYKAAAYLMRAVVELTDGVTQFSKIKNPTSILAGF